MDKFYVGILIGLMFGVFAVFWVYGVHIWWGERKDKQEQRARSKKLAEDNAKAFASWRDRNETNSKQED